MIQQGPLAGSTQSATDREPIKYTKSFLLTFRNKPECQALPAEFKNPNPDLKQTLKKVLSPHK